VTFKSSLQRLRGQGGSAATWAAELDTGYWEDGGTQELGLSETGPINIRRHGDVLVVKPEEGFVHKASKMGAKKTKIGLTLDACKGVSILG